MAAPFRIDLHTHILPPSLPDLRARYGYGGFVALERAPGRPARLWIDGEPFRDIPDVTFDAVLRLEECDRKGIAVQVLSTVPVMFSYWAEPEHGLDLARLLNDHIAETVAAHPRRFAGLATLPMQDSGAAVRELERAVRQLGLSGAEIGTHVNGLNLDRPEVFAVLEAARDLGAAIFVHPWDMLGAERMRRYWLPWLVGMPAESSLALCSVLFGGVLERLPGLRIAFAHGGGAFPGTFGRIEHGFRVRPDLVAVDNPVPPRETLRRVVLDSLVHDPDMLRLLIKMMGPERIALGSDYPFPLGEEEPGRLIESLSDLPAATRQRMLAGTALEFLGRDAAEFGA